MDDGPSLLDTITISGRDTRCKEAAEALKALIPVTKTVSFRAILFTSESFG